MFSILKKDPKAESIEVGEFAHQHKGKIIIVADPEDDTIFVAFNDRFVSGRIKTSDGEKAKILRDMMSRSDFFDKNIDRFLMSLGEVMRIRRMSKGVNNFLQYLDGALYNISQRHRVAVKGGSERGESPSKPQVDPVPEKSG